MTEYAVERVYDAISDEARFFVIERDNDDTVAGPYNSADAAFVIARRIQSNNGTVSRTLYDPHTGKKIK